MTRPDEQAIDLAREELRSCIPATCRLCGAEGHEHTATCPRLAARALSIQTDLTNAARRRRV